jgi:hypothetical protein
VRSPSANFRSELKAFQQRLPAVTPANDHWKGRLAHIVLARWIDHTECESIWTTLRPLLPAEMTAGDFIGAVILARNDAEQLNIIVQEAPGLEAKVHTRTKRHLKAKQYSQIAEENALLGEFVTRRARELGREKTGPRINFMRRISMGLELWCGQPLDNVARVLTEIAFGQPVTTEAMRAARSPKVRRNRGTRPPK